MPYSPLSQLPELYKMATQYTVQPGDTLANIAAQKKMSVQNLMSYNPSIKDPNKIQAGSNLNLIPASYGNYSPLGQKTTDPYSKISTPPNITNQPAPPTPATAGSTEGGTGSTPPAYDRVTGRLTDYGRSKGLPDINAPKPVSGALGSLQDQRNAINPTTGVNQNQSTTSPYYTPQNQGTTGVSQGGVIHNLIRMANTEPPEVAQARQEIADIQNKYAQLGVNINNTAGTMTQAGGEEALLTGQYNTALAAAQQKLANALQVRGQSISALGGAASANAPTGNFPFVFQPSTGTFSMGGGIMGGLIGGASVGITFTGNPSTDAQNAAQAVMSGKMTYKQAQDSLSYAGVSGNSFLNSAIISQGGDPLKLQAQGEAQQTNIHTAGTAGVSANQKVLDKAYSDYLDLQQSVQNVDQFGNLLVKTPGGINALPFRLGNLTIQAFRNQLSSSAQSQFDTTLAALKGKITGLLNVGGNETPSALTEQANKILDGTAKMSTIQDTLNRIAVEGNILLQNSAKKVNTAFEGIQNPNPTASEKNPAVTSNTPNVWH